MLHTSEASLFLTFVVVRGYNRRICCSSFGSETWISYVLSSFVVVLESVRHVWLFVTPRTAACQAPLSFTVSQSFLKFMALSQWCYLSISSFAASFSYIPLPINWTLWLNENWPESSFYLKSFCWYLWDLPTFLCKLIIVIIVISFTPRYHFQTFPGYILLKCMDCLFCVCFQGTSLLYGTGRHL